jgi:hypothetical protein
VSSPQSGLYICLLSWDSQSQRPHPVDRCPVGTPGQHRGTWNICVLALSFTWAHWGWENRVSLRLAPQQHTQQSSCTSKRKLPSYQTGTEGHNDFQRKTNQAEKAPESAT